LTNIDSAKAIALITALSYANRELYHLFCKDTSFFKDDELNKTLKNINYQIKLKKFDKCNEILKKYSAINTHGATTLYLLLKDSCP
jgi:cytochrome c oxidase assembly protein Cox11